MKLWPWRRQERTVTIDLGPDFGRVSVRPKSVDAADITSADLIDLEWCPQGDITAYELALHFPMLVSIFGFHEPGARITAHKLWWDGHHSTLRRHFKEHPCDR